MFPHAAQAVQIVRTRKRKNSSSKRETVYAVTSLTTEQADPAELAGHIREHGFVENKPHWVRDVTMGEDPSRIRTSGGPHMIASPLRLAGHANIAKALRHNAKDPKRAVKLVTTS